MLLWSQRTRNYNLLRVNSPSHLFFLKSILIRFVSVIIDYVSHVISAGFPNIILYGIWSPCLVIHPNSSSFVFNILILYTLYRKVIILFSLFPFSYCFPRKSAERHYEICLVFLSICTVARVVKVMCKFFGRVSECLYSSTEKFVFNYTSKF